MTFRRSSDLKRHAKQHLDVPANICQLCGKGFARKDALKRHMGTLTCKRNANKKLYVDNLAFLNSDGIGRGNSTGRSEEDQDDDDDEDDDDEDEEDEEEEDQDDDDEEGGRKRKKNKFGHNNNDQDEDDDDEDDDDIRKPNFPTFGYQKTNWKV